MLNAVFGTIVAWVLVRYNFPGKRMFDGLVDLPFALPTAVAGISLTAIYAQNGLLGRWFAELGIQTAYSRLGSRLLSSLSGCRSWSARFSRCY